MGKTTPNQKIHSPPSCLKSIQEWFASIITQRLSKNDTIQIHQSDGTSIIEESARYIVPNATLQPHQRMQIYNQQYWWRLLKTLHNNFPLMTRFFCYHAFNERIGIPYLLKYPPNHWSLNFLGKRLPQWIAQHYEGHERHFILNASHLDWAFMASMVAPQHPVPNLFQIAEKDPHHLISQIFYLQPHIHLFTWEYHLLKLREDFFKTKN